MTPPAPREACGQRTVTSATVVWRDVGHLIAASSIASVHLCPLPREEFGNCSLEVDFCTCVSQQFSQRGLDCSVGVAFVLVPAYTAGCVSRLGRSLSRKVSRRSP